MKNRLIFLFMENVESILHHQIETGKTPSLVYSIFDDRNTLYEFAGGFADVRKKVRTDTATVYHLFSVTKTFTALSILQLAEKGEINLNESAKKYLTDFPYPPEITIIHLLNHSSGLSNPIPLSWVHQAGEHSTFNRNAFFESIYSKNPEVHSLPNVRFAYSNLGYFYLGRIIEIITGETFEGYVSENIIKRINVERELTFTILPEQKRAKGYHKRMSFSNLILGIMFNKKKFMNGEEEGWMSFKECYVNGPSYGGLMGSVNGLKKYLQELLKQDSHLLTPAYKEKLFTENRLNSGKASGMCASWFVDHMGKLRYYTHAGGGGGYYCEIRLYPDTNRCSIILFNRTGMRDERFLDKIDRFFL